MSIAPTPIAELNSAQAPPSSTSINNLLDRLQTAQEAEDSAKVQDLVTQLPSSLPTSLLQSLAIKTILNSALHTTLEHSATEGDLELAKATLSRWSPDAWGLVLTSKDLLSPLLAAATGGYLNIVECLLEHGAEITPVVVGLLRNTGCRVDLIPVLEVFKVHGWNVNMLAHNEVPLLINMIERESIVRWLLENGADPNALSTGSRALETPLEAAANRSSIAVIELLLHHGAMLQDSYPLHFAATRPEVEDERAVAMMDFFLGRGLDVNELRFERHPERLRENSEGATALHWAARGRWIGRVRWLVERGANVCKKSTRGNRPLDWARLARKSNREVIELLERTLEEGGK